MARCWLAPVCALLLGCSSVTYAAADKDPAGGAGAILGSAWETVTSGAGSVWAALTSLFGAPDPFQFLPEQMTERGRHFLGLMDTAGYRLVSIDTNDGLVGHVSYRFEQQREPSPADLELVRRGLAEHTARFGGPSAAAERRAIRGLLALTDAPDFRIAGVRLEILSWPEVSFHLAAREQGGTTP